MLTSLLDPSKYYIGSSVNLGRRLEEYYNLTLNIRAPGSRSEAEFAAMSADNISVMILDLAIPSQVRLLEQLAILNFLPTINRSYHVDPLVDPK